MKNPTGNDNQSRYASAAAAASQKDSSNDLAPEIATALSSRFEPLELVGASQSAFYYLGCDLLASLQNQPVKVKVFSPQALDGSKQLDLFILEARSAASLSHRNILRASPPEIINGIYFSVIEHRAGTETLSRMLDRKGWLDLKLAVEIARQIADALDHAHGLGVLHLKIQPENILLDRGSRAIVADFGLEAGNDLSWAHRERARQTSAQYISPELIEGKTVDSRSDLYSLGLVLYKMLADRLPFDSEDSDDIRQKHLTQAPMPLHLYRPDVPLRLSALINCLLEKNPSRRMQSAGALRSALDHFASSYLDTIEQNHEQSRLAAGGSPADRATIATSSPGENSTLDSPEKRSTVVVDKPESARAFIESKPPQARASESPKRRLEKSGDVDSPPLGRWSKRVAYDERRRRQTLLWFLVVVLSLGVASGLIAIAQYGKSKDVSQKDVSQKQIPLKVELGKNSAGGEISTSPPSTNDSTKAGRQPGPNTQQTKAGNDAGDRQAGAGVTPRTSRKRSVRSAASRKANQPKRKPSRARRFRRG